MGLEQAEWVATASVCYSGRGFAVKPWGERAAGGAQGAFVMFLTEDGPALRAEQVAFPRACTSPAAPSGAGRGWGRARLVRPRPFPKGQTFCAWRSGTHSHGDNKVKLNVLVPYN